MKLYVASSWRNETLQQAAVGLLESIGHEVYDFIHPPGGDHLGFSWGDVDADWRSWSSPAYRRALEHPTAVAGFESDFGAMQWADAGVLLLPCGRSAHLEAGWFVGAGKPLWIVLDEAEFPAPGGSNPELMYRMASGIFTDLGELMNAIGRGGTARPTRIQRQRTKGWRMPEGAVYVGRPSRWGNTWTVDTEWYDGLGGRFRVLETPADLVAAYRQDMGLLEPEELEREVGPLRGRDLVCWCPLDQPCHADVLLKLANPAAA